MAGIYAYKVCGFETALGTRHRPGKRIVAANALPVAEYILHGAGGIVCRFF